MPDGAAPPGERSAMSEETRTMQTADTTPARAPEDAPALVKKIGKTTYKVRVHFSDTSTETMSDKIKRMLKTRYSRCKHSGPETFKQASGPFHARRKGAEVNPPRLHFRETVRRSCTLDVPYPDLKSLYRR